MVLSVAVYDMTVDAHGCEQNGSTPIVTAAVSSYKECIEMLAGLGGDVNKAMTVSVEGAAQSVVIACAGVCNMLSWVSWCWVLMCMI